MAAFGDLVTRKGILMRVLVMSANVAIINDDPVITAPFNDNSHGASHAVPALAPVPLILTKR